MQPAVPPLPSVGRVCPWLCRLGAVLALSVVPAQAAVLRGATLAVTFADASACQVHARYTLDAEGARVVEHRLQLMEGATVELLEVGGDAVPSGEVVVVGATRALQLRPTGEGRSTYTLLYRVRQPQPWAHRCPLWLPAVPADGRSRDVSLSVALPDGAVRLGGSLPTLAWRGTGGTVTLGHVPAFVRVPFRLAGERVGSSWDVVGMMDATAVVALAAGMVFFAWRRRRT